MSIAVLKKKTQSQYNNSSVGQKQFSINGTLRSQGYIGQTILSRSLPKTLARGPTLRGAGGCCGKYDIHPIVQSGINYFNNPNVVKPSVINTKGMIEKKYAWTKRPEPYASVKPTSMTMTQSDRIQKIHNETLKYASKKECTKNKDLPYSCKKCMISNNYNYYPSKPYGDPSKTATNSSSEFTQNILIRNCNFKDLSNNRLQKCGQPIACGS